jgi:hypothetical protein
VKDFLISQIRPAIPDKNVAKNRISGGADAITTTKQIAVVTIAVACLLFRFLAMKCFHDDGLA